LDHSFVVTTSRVKNIPMGNVTRVPLAPGVMYSKSGHDGIPKRLVVRYQEVFDGGYPKRMENQKPALEVIE